MANNDGEIVLGLDIPKTVSQINADIKKLENQLAKVKATGALDTSSTVKQINSQISALQSQLKSINLKTNVNMSDAQKTGQKIGQTVANSVQKTIDGKDINIDKLNADIKTLVNNLNSFSSKNTGFDSFKTEINGAEVSLNSLIDKLSTVNNTADLSTVRSQASALKTTFSELKRISEIQLSMDNGHGVSEYQIQINKAIASLKQYGAEAQKVDKINTDLQLAFDKMKGLSGQALIDQAGILKQKLDSAKISIDEAKLSYDKLMQPASKEKVTATLLKVQKLLANNTRVTEQIRQEWQSYVTQLSSGSDIAEDKIKSINLRLKETESTMREAGRLGLSWTDKFKKTWDKFSSLGIATGTMMTLMNQLRKIPEEVIDVNSAMVELSKVSDATASDIKKYFDEAAESAQELGSSVSDVISATADWSRLGYSLSESSELAKVATLYKNVGDGIDINAANESLVSTLQGFQLDAEDAMGIIDKFNEVANSFPIDSAGIGEALQKSAASFYAANTDLSKSIALITGTNSVIQDPDSVGTMWKTVGMRIRGTKQELEEAGEDTEGMVESASELRELVQGLTGFDIMADEAGTQFKDIYDIIVGIGHEWKNLTDVEQAGLLETLAGKMQGNALSAALNNVSMIEEAYTTAENSAGSALKEQEKYEQGVQYSLDRLEASFQTFANHILDSDFLKGIIDFGNSTINVIDAITNKLGSFGTIGLGAGLFAGVKNIGKSV